MPRIVLLVINLVLLPAVAAAERVLLQMEGSAYATHSVKEAVFSPDGAKVLTGGATELRVSGTQPTGERFAALRDMMN